MDVPIRIHEDKIILKQYSCLGLKIGNKNKHISLNVKIEFDM